MRWAGEEGGESRAGSPGHGKWEFLAAHQENVLRASPCEATRPPRVLGVVVSPWRPGAGVIRGGCWGQLEGVGQRDSPPWRFGWYPRALGICSVRAFPRGGGASGRLGWGAPGRTVHLSGAGAQEAGPLCTVSTWAQVAPLCSQVKGSQRRTGRRAPVPRYGSTPQPPPRGPPMSLQRSAHAPS